MATAAVNVTESLTVRRMEKGSHEFLVKNYSLYKGIGPNEAIESEHFMVGGHKWAIRFYPGGKDKDDGFASLYISLKSEWSNAVRILYEIYIVDQFGRGNDWGNNVFLEENRPELTPYHHARCWMSGYDDFIERASLSNYLKDDSLKISCTIGVLTSDIQDFPTIEIPKPTIDADLGKLLESKRGADIFFKVGGERFCAHKCILKVRSPILLSYLPHAHKNQEIAVLKMEPRVFKAMLWFIYTGTLVEEAQDAFGDSQAFILNSFMVKMLAAADEFQLENLKRICESRILESASAESAAYLSHLAELYHAPELKAACPSFSAEYESADMGSVKDCNGSECLEESCPLFFLEMASYKESSEPQMSTSRARELNLCTKIFSVVKGLIRPLDTLQKKKKKIKAKMMMMMMKKKKKEEAKES